MPARNSQFPTYRERSALQLLLKKDWLPATRLLPAGPTTISGMMKKGWLRRKQDLAFGSTYCITPKGEVALRALIPSEPYKRGKND
jgi:hypothetical protein